VDSCQLLILAGNFFKILDKALVLDEWVNFNNLRDFYNLNNFLNWGYYFNWFTFYHNNFSDFGLFFRLRWHLDGSGRRKHLDTLLFKFSFG
jgi:hypothetical protein